MFEIKKITFLLIITLLLLGLIIPPGASQDFNEPFVGEYDEYHWEGEPGEEKTFKYVIERTDDLNYTVNIILEDFGDVDAEIDPDWFILDDKNEMQIVTLSVELPTFPEKESITGTINFRFSREGETINKYSEVSIDIIGLPEAPEANTIVGGFENPLPPPLDGPLGAFILNLVIWFSVALASYFIITPFLKKLASKTKTDLDELLLEMVRRPLLIFIFLYGLIHSILRFDLPGALRGNIYQLYSFAALLIGIYVTYQIFDGFLKEIAARRGGYDSPFNKIIKPIFEKIGMIVILLGGLIIGFNILGIQVTALLAGAGILGLVIAFAAQDTLSNFFSGIHLLLDRPFTIGDVLELESGEFCRVERVGMRSTALYDIRSHEMIILPNNSIANQKIKNLSEPDRKIRALVNVGVAYGSDIDKVKEILYEVLQDQEGIILQEGHEPVVRFAEFADSSLQFNLRFWIDDYIKQWEIASNIRDRIDEEFREAEVTIPFPQRTVWLKEKSN